MTGERELAARLVGALTAAADSEAGAPTALVSITIDMLAQAAEADVTAQLVRKTRTLVFMNAEARGGDGALIAAASSVHKIQG